MEGNSLCPLLDEYLNLVDDTESPILYHRWCFLTGVAALLHRRTCFPMATGAVYPNMFVVLLGPPGARKSTAIGMVGKLLSKAGYTHIASGKTSPEQFLLDLKDGFDTIRVKAEDLDLMGLQSPEQLITQCSHVLINAGELQDFLGLNSISFISQLTNLWDNPDDYPYRVKSGANLELLNKPTVSLLGGATQATFKRMFPIDIVGQGLLSRFLLIHGAGPRKRVWMPKPLDTDTEKGIVDFLKLIGSSPDIPREYKYSTNAADFSRTLYEAGEQEITDPRFQHYANRRNDHYMKLCLLIAAMNIHQKIEENDCILANTILTYTEKFMPLALGEFGLDQGSEHVEYLYGLIKRAKKGLTIPEILSQGIATFKSPAELAGHLAKLKAAKRIDQINYAGTLRYLAIERTVSTDSKMLDFDILKEYQENPTFNTAFETTNDKAAEWELNEAIKEAAKEISKATNKIHIIE